MRSLGFYGVVAPFVGGGGPPPSGITYLGAVRRTDGAPADLTVLSLQEGDLLMAFHTSDNNTGGNVAGYDANWTAIRNDRTTNSSVNAIEDYRICGPTPPTSMVWSGNNSGIIVAFRGVNTTTPFDVTSTIAGGTTGMPNPPSITPTTNGCMILAVGHLDDDLVAAAVAAPDPFTLCAADEFSGGGSTQTSMVARFLQETAGAIDPGVFTATGGSDDWAATTHALRPA